MKGRKDIRFLARDLDRLPPKGRVRDLGNGEWHFIAEGFRQPFSTDEVYVGDNWIEGSKIDPKKRTPFPFKEPPPHAMGDGRRVNEGTPEASTVV